MRDAPQVPNFQSFLSRVSASALALSVVLVAPLSLAQSQGQAPSAQPKRQDAGGQAQSGDRNAKRQQQKAQAGKRDSGAKQGSQAADKSGAASGSRATDGKQAGDGAQAARRDGKAPRRNKPKKPRAFEQSPQPERSGPTMLASAAAATAALTAAATATVLPEASAAAATSAGAAATVATAPSAADSESGSTKTAKAAAPAEAKPSVGESRGLRRAHDPLSLQSSVAFVVDAQSGAVLVDKNPSAVLPIASITKLMTAMVVLDAGLPLGERLQISADDIDRMRHTGSRLHPGARLTRGELLQLALMSSENRAANALGRHYPGGMPAFVNAMNAKARGLGMNDSRFVEPTGLSSANVASARDLARLVRAASAYPTIRNYSTARSMTVQPAREPLGFYNTNRLISTAGWSIGLQKTGFISEAGNCMVMMANIEGRQTIFVLLDAAGKLARFGDAQRIRGWLEQGSGPRTPSIRATPGQREPGVAPLRVSLGQ